MNIIAPMTSDTTEHISTKLMSFMNMVDAIVPKTSISMIIRATKAPDSEHP